MDLADVNAVSIFAPHVGSEFRIEAGPGTTVRATLVEAEPYSQRDTANDGASRAPFSLLFEIGDAEALPQSTYTVHHDALGAVPLFLVPVGANTMESVFN